MEEDIILYLRHLRHDYLNTLMVVDGYLQIGKSERARQTIETASRDIRAEGEVLRLTYPSFALELLMAKPQLYQKGITLELKVTTDLAGGRLKEDVLKTVLAKLHSLSDQVEGYSNQWEFSLSSPQNRHQWRLSLGGLSEEHLAAFRGYLDQFGDELTVEVETDSALLLSWDKVGTSK